jgi:quercetin dioxygenase-like cupin family protein
VAISTGKPYSDVIENDYIIREFSTSVSSEELIWHRDKLPREVTVLQGEGWKVQIDNQLPEDLEEGKLYEIPRMEYHRLIKGIGTLLIQIKENKND